MMRLLHAFARGVRKRWDEAFFWSLPILFLVWAYLVNGFGPFSHADLSLLPLVGMALFWQAAKICMRRNRKGSIKGFFYGVFAGFQLTIFSAFCLLFVLSFGASSVSTALMVAGDTDAYKAQSAEFSGYLTADRLSPMVSDFVYTVDRERAESLLGKEGASGTKVSPYYHTEKWTAGQLRKFGYLPEKADGAWTMLPFISRGPDDLWFGIGLLASSENFAESREEFEAGMEVMLDERPEAKNWSNSERFKAFHPVIHKGMMSDRIMMVYCMTNIMGETNVFMNGTTQIGVIKLGYVPENGVTRPLYDACKQAASKAASDRAAQ